MNNTKKRLLENFISLGALQVVSYTLPLITLPYLSRTLTSEKFGLVFFAFAFMQYFVVLTDFGFNLSATREIAVNRHNQNNLSNIFNSVTTLKILLVLVSYICLTLCSIFIPKIHQDWLIYQLSFLMVVGNAFYPVWFFQGMEQMKYITFLNILSKLIFLVLIFIFVRQDSDYVITPLLNSMGFVVSGIIGFVFAVRKFNIKLYIPSIRAIKKQFKYSSEFFLSRAAVTVFTCTNTFFIGLISSNVMVAYYVAAERIYTALKNLVQPVEKAIYPFIAKNKDINTYKKIFKLTMLANTFLCLIVFIFSKQIITIFYGTEMLKAYRILQIFSFGIFVVWFSALLGYPLLGALGKTKEVNGAVVIASVVHIIGLCLLYMTKHLNVYSISYLTLLSECVILGITGYFVWKYKLLGRAKQ